MITIRLGQLAEALVRPRSLRRRHSPALRGLSVEQRHALLSETRRFLEEATARREAERGTFDPTYLVYSLGKLMMLKLRR
jgi:hypothetical protein